MKKRILRYFKHIFGTLLVFVIIASSILISENGALHYGDNNLKMNWDQDGPYVFYENDSTLKVKYIKGDMNNGFYVNEEKYNTNDHIIANCYFALDSSKFHFSIKNKFEIPKSIYSDTEKILAISDIESGYKSFRDFLINNKVINQQLNWTFGKGHLVLVGDFVDRGFSTTQVLWFIYKLEQDAKKQGGNVHYIIGNHELKNLQGNYEAASQKYTYISAILGKQQYNLYDSNSYIGRWLESKNTMEIINGHLFTHGGIHPEVAALKVPIDELNKIIRTNYRKTYFPKPRKNTNEILTSTNTGPSWYRGYFKDDNLTQDEVEQGLKKFNVKTIIVGHTIQSKINRSFNGKIIGIDVHHPNDYHKNWPSGKSEGLLIKDEKFYRVFDNGDIEKI